ncbi:hypothetical protein HCH54_005334 [Aspergillus fumigatus]
MCGGYTDNQLCADSAELLMPLDRQARKILATSPETFFSLPAERTIGKKLQTGGRGRRSVVGFLSPCVHFPDSATSHNFTSIKSKKGREIKKKKEMRKGEREEKRGK